MIFEETAGLSEFKQKAKDRWRMISSYIDSISKDDFDQVRSLAIFRWSRSTLEADTEKPLPNQKLLRGKRKRKKTLVFLKTRKITSAESQSSSHIKSNIILLPLVWKIKSNGMKTTILIPFLRWKLNL